MAGSGRIASNRVVSQIYLLSDIKGLYDSMMDLAPPGITIKHLDISDLRSRRCNPELYDSYFFGAEVAICDPVAFPLVQYFMPSLKWMHSTWAGVDSVVKYALRNPNLLVTRHAGSDFSKAMAEYVICHIINCERLTKFCWEKQQDKVWADTGDFMKSRSLDQITVSILGIGNMGSAVGEILKSRGTRTFGFAKHERVKKGNQWFDKISCNLDEILPECDYVCNTLPSTPLTAGLLTSSVLEKCEKKPVFINCGRGDIISEKDLIEALKKGFLSGAVLDVFQEEPLPKSSPLWSMPEVTITPHVAALSRPDDIAKNFYENLPRYAVGAMENVVDWQKKY